MSTREATKGNSRDGIGLSRVLALSEVDVGGRSHSDNCDVLLCWLAPSFAPLRLKLVKSGFSHPFGNSVSWRNWEK